MKMHRPLSLGRSSRRILYVFYVTLQALGGLTVQLVAQASVAGEIPRCLLCMFYVALKALGVTLCSFVCENKWAPLAGMPQVGRLHVEMHMFRM